MTDEERLLALPAQAFPSVSRMPSGGTFVMPGLTKREWYAGMALIGEISRCGIEPTRKDIIGAMVERCFMFADLMIERSKS
jgi:hypothetical protein